MRIRACRLFLAAPLVLAGAGCSRTTVEPMPDRFPRLPTASSFGNVWIEGKLYTDHAEIFGTNLLEEGYVPVAVTIFLRGEGVDRENSRVSVEDIKPSLYLADGTVLTFIPYDRIHIDPGTNARIMEEALDINVIQPESESREGGLASVSFLLIAAFLSQHVEKSIQIQRTTRTINAVLSDEFSSRYSGVVEPVDRADFRLTQDEESGEELAVHVLASVRSPVALTPGDVTHLQTKLSSALSTRVQLMVRNSIQRDVAAVGSGLEVATSSGGGRLLKDTTSKEQTAARLAEQVIREGLSSEPGFELIAVDYGETKKFPFIVASIDTFRSLTTEDVRSLRHALRARLRADDLQLLVRSYDSRLMTSEERFLFEWTDVSGLLDVDEIVIGDIRSIVKEEVEHFPDLFCVDVHFRMSEKPWHVLAEVVGPRRPTAEQLAEIEKAVSQRSAFPIATTLWYREEAVLTPQGYTSYEKFTERTREQRVRTVPSLFGRGASEGHE